MLLCQVQLQLHARFLIVSVLVSLMNQLRKKKIFQFIHETINMELDREREYIGNFINDIIEMGSLISS